MKKANLKLNPIVAVLILSQGSAYAQDSRLGIALNQIKRDILVGVCTPEMPEKLECRKDPKTGRVAAKLCTNQKSSTGLIWNWALLQDPETKKYCGDMVDLIRPQPYALPSSYTAEDLALYRKEGLRARAEAADVGITFEQLMLQRQGVGIGTAPTGSLIYKFQIEGKIVKLY